MDDRPEPPWGRALWPLQAERISAVANAHINMVSVFAIATILLSSITLPAQSKAPPSAKQTAKPALPSDDPQLVRNSALGFRYQIPYGWVDRTQQMQQGNEASKSEVLLAIFERPPEVTGDTINSAVVIASESTASYPGLKKAEDYLSPLTELTTAKGFKADGEPYPLEVESRQLLRADFVKTIVGKTTNETLTMHQCTLFLLVKGKIVSFTFIAGSEDEIDGLTDGLHFGVAQPNAKPRP